MEYKGIGVMKKLLFLTSVFALLGMNGANAAVQATTTCPSGYITIDEKYGHLSKMCATPYDCLWFVDSCFDGTGSSSNVCYLYATEGVRYSEGSDVEFKVSGPCALDGTGLKKCVDLPGTCKVPTSSAVYNRTNATKDCGGVDVQVVSMCSTDTGNMGDEKAYLTTGANATNCWCKMTLPMVTNWLFGMQLNTAADCNRQCAYDCITLSTTFYSGSSSVLY